MSGALTAAVLAGGREIIRLRTAGAVAFEYKSATELVTAADRSSDAAMLSVLREKLPLRGAGMSIHLEESGLAGPPMRRRVGADPLDGTAHFAAGGSLYSVQAHYVEDDIARVGVVFQPEVHLPTSVTSRCVGRLVSAIRDGGATVRQTHWEQGAFSVGPPVPVRPCLRADRRTYVGCVPISGKMTTDERDRVLRVYSSGVLGATAGTGGAGGNILMVVFGGLDVYANFGAGEDLDLIPPQVIAREAGLVVWNADRQEPTWSVRKQPVVVATTASLADRILTAAGW